MTDSSWFLMLFARKTSELWHFLCVQTVAIYVYALLYGGMVIIHLLCSLLENLAFHEQINKCRSCS